MTAGQTKLVIAEFVPPAVHDRFNRLGQVVYDPNLAGDRAALAAALTDTEALVVRNRTRVDTRLLHSAPLLRVVGRLGAGLDNIDRSACRRRGVAVVYSPWGNAVSVAEHTLALALALARRLPAAQAMARQPHWDRAAVMGMELWGKTWGVLGFGNVGRFVAAAVRGLGLRCITYHPRKETAHPDLAAAAVQSVDENEFWRRADIVSVHLPLTAQTKHYVSVDRLNRLQPGSLLINVARGGVLDEGALLAALKAGVLAGAALDVREQEPPSRPDPLADLAQVVLTPHGAGLTYEAQVRVASQVAADIQRVLKGQPPLYPAPSRCAVVRGRDRLPAYRRGDRRRRRRPPT